MCQAGLQLRMVQYDTTRKYLNILSMSFEKGQIFWDYRLTFSFVLNVTAYFPPNCTEENLNFVSNAGIRMVQKTENPPCCPQIRPIEKFFSLLKQCVYDKNWKAKNKNELENKIRRTINF